MSGRLRGGWRSLNDYDSEVRHYRKEVLRREGKKLLVESTVEGGKESGDVRVGKNFVGG